MSKMLSSFLLGFEVECVINEDKIDLDVFSKKILALNPGIDIGDDGSIYANRDNNNGTGVEIRTPPLKTYAALRLLKKTFQLVNKYGYTNESTGFHINLSPISDKIYYSINPFTLVKDKLWGRMRKSFKRNGNEYCDDVEIGDFAELLEKKPLKLWTDLIGGGNINFGEDNVIGKSCVVNFDSYSLRRNNDSRLEIRACGGEGYHKKFGLIKDYTLKSLTTFRKHCNI